MAISFFSPELYERPVYENITLGKSYEVIPSNDKRDDFKVLGEFISISEIFKASEDSDIKAKYKISRYLEGQSPNWGSNENCEMVLYFLPYTFWDYEEGIDLFDNIKKKIEEYGKKNN